ncbi:MAG: hypothetical protein V4541_07300 [Bacteroidota bacterium]
MELFKISIFLFGLLLIGKESLATNGCYLATDGYVYTQTNNQGLYKKNGNKVFVGFGACRKNGGAGASCSVNYSPVRPGHKGNFDVVFCPFDNRTWILLSCTLIAGFVLLKKKQSNYG